MQKESRKSLKIEEVIAVVYKPLKHGTNSTKFSLYFKGNVSLTFSQWCVCK